jgi:predicted small lipoprotein YifL
MRALLTCSLIATLLLAGCGQKGRLVLPEKKKSTPVAAQPAASPSPAAAAPAATPPPAHDPADDTTAPKR